MPFTYEQAREIIRDHLEPGWTHGTFCLDDTNIVENDEFFVFEVGAREFLVDGDGSYEAHRRRARCLQGGRTRRVAAFC